MTAIFVFGFDIAEASQIRRIRLFQAAGLEVSSAAMRRENMNRDFRPDWPNVELSTVPNGRLGLRLVAILMSALKMLRHRRSVAASDVIWARNFDMLVIAWLSRLVAGSDGPRPPLVYEALDIHSLFTRADMLGRITRAAERFLLRRIDLLVISSPGFMQHYFLPVQHYGGPHELIENKISFADAAPARPTHRKRPEPGDVPVLGWVGTLRCRTSFDLLTSLARRMGDRLEIRMHGIVHDHVLPDFHQRIADLDNVRFDGPYDYPDGLIDVYRGCHLVWAQDLWQTGGNSDWLLPNRIYEASWCGCPSVAVAGTVTGRYVTDRRLGFVVEKPTVEALAECIAQTWPGKAVAVSEELLARDPRAFQQSGQDILNALGPVLQQAMIGQEGECEG